MESAKTQSIRCSMRVRERETVAKKKTGATTNKTGADQSGSSDDGKKRRNGTNGARNGQKSKGGGTGGKSGDKAIARRAARANSEQQQQQQQQRRPSVRSEPSGWAAIVTGTSLRAKFPRWPGKRRRSRTPNQRSTTRRRRPQRQGEDCDVTSSEGKANDDRAGSVESEEPSSPGESRETRLIDRARENSQVVGAGAKALRGWASILGGSTASPTASDDATEKTSFSAEENHVDESSRARDASGAIGPSLERGL